MVERGIGGSWVVKGDEGLWKEDYEVRCLLGWLVACYAILVRREIVKLEFSIVKIMSIFQSKIIISFLEAAFFSFHVSKVGEFMDAGSMPAKRRKLDKQQCFGL